MNNDLDKYPLLLNKLKEKKKVAVAFSGGIDSTLVAYASKDSGIDVILITITSPLFSSNDEKIAKQIAQELEINQIIISNNGLNENVAKNGIKRCYYCKRDEAKIWRAIAEKQGFKVLADGANYEDIQDDRRPGVKACDEIGIWHPLAELKITKKDIREIARKLGISIWNRPSNACLASRIVYGEKITLEKLKMIEKAEDFLRNISQQIRVRLHKNIARIEVPIEVLNDILGKREEIVDYMKKIGFIYITLDMEGYRSGSMHEDRN